MGKLDSVNSISGSFINLDDDIRRDVIEELGPFKEELEAQGVDFSKLSSKEVTDLIKIRDHIERYKDGELDDASDLADLIKEQIAGFDQEKLREMCIFSKISYGNVDKKLEKSKYKTKRQFEEEGYQIIKFYDNELIEDKYCLDNDYKLEQHDIGYALTGGNSYNRDAGYVFIKDGEVTIAYHGTRDLNDVKEDLRASLTKLSFLPEDNYAHSGFYYLFKRSWPSVHKILQGHANDRGVAIKDLKINVTGHSMGGAVASIAALCLDKTEDAKDVHVATFGSPRVFYNGAAEVYNECLGNNTIRVACQSDPVPCLPHGNAGMHYKHVGKPLKLGTDKTVEYLEPRYHKIDTYYNLIQKVQQENFKSDSSTSKFRHIAYVCGLVYYAVLPRADDNDKEFFKKVEEENKSIKLSEIPIAYAPNLEEKLKQGEQEVARLTAEFKEKEVQFKENKRKLDGANQKVLELEQKLDNTNQVLTKKTDEFKSTKAQLEESKKELDTARQDVLQSRKDLKQVQQNLAEKTSEVTQLIREFGEIKAQLEQENHNLASQIRSLKGKCEQVEAQLAESKQNLAEETIKATQFSKESDKTKAQLEEKEKEIGELKDQIARLTVQMEEQLNDARQDLTDKTDEVTQLKQEYDGIKAQFEEKIRELNGQVTQLTAQNIQLERQLNSARQGLTNKTDEVTQLKNENNDLKTKLQESENKSRGLEKNLQKQLESENEELNEKFLGASIDSKRQANYVSVSFVLSGAFAVGTSLTMFHLAMCISLAVAALTFLAVGCYCSYKANTVLNEIEVDLIKGDINHMQVA